MMKRFFSLFSIYKVLTKSLAKGSILWKSWLVTLVIFRVIRWLFAKPQPKIIEEYELGPVEYKVVIDEVKNNGS